MNEVGTMSPNQDPPAPHEMDSEPVVQETARPRAAITAPLRHRAFRFLFLGQVISDLGDWLDLLALIALIVYHWELGASALAALSVTAAIPRIIFAPVAGVMADRWPRRTIMIACDLVRALVVAGLIWAPNLTAVLMLVFVKSVFSTFFSPSRQASIRMTVPEDDLLAASSLSQLSVQITKILGPIVGGVLVSVAGPRIAFGVDALSFLLSALFLSQLPALIPPQQANPDEAEPGFWSEFRSGFSYLVQKRTLTLAVGSMSAALFMIFIIDSLGVLALQALGVGEALFGLAIGAIGLGTLVGAVTIGERGKAFHPFKIMGLGQIVSGLMIAFMGLAVVFQLNATGLAWVLVYLVIGVSAAAVFVPYSYVLQVETPEALMGRVFASADGIQTVFQLLAPPLGALLAEQWGVGPVFVLAGGLLGLIGLTVFLLRPVVNTASDSTEPNLETNAAQA
jgi:MFS family permease